MPVTAITKDLDNRTLTITAEFAAPVERVWQIYADPRQLEKIWGPPTYPATFVDHDLSVGSRVTYYMTSPEGEKFRGYWLITEVEPGRRFAFEDGFALDDFSPNPDLPVSQNVFAFAATATGTLATYTSTYASADDLRTVLEMGMEEGATLSINQIDGFLAG
ncbi:MAG: SRPBCC domain-containing protein [Actinomycetales bacterium]